MVDTALVRVSEKTKSLLDQLKQHPRETYDDVLRRLIKYFKEVKNGRK